MTDNPKAGSPIAGGVLGTGSPIVDIRKYRYDLGIFGDKQFLGFLKFYILIIDLTFWWILLDGWVFSWEPKGAPPMPSPPINKALLRDY